MKPRLIFSYSIGCLLVLGKPLSAATANDIADGIMLTPAAAGSPFERGIQLDQRQESGKKIFSAAYLGGSGRDVRRVVPKSFYEEVQNGIRRWDLVIRRVQSSHEVVSCIDPVIFIENSKSNSLCLSSLTAVDRRRLLKWFEETADTIRGNRP